MSVFIGPQHVDGRTGRGKKDADSEIVKYIGQRVGIYSESSTQPGHKNCTKQFVAGILKSATWEVTMWSLTFEEPVTLWEFELGSKYWTNYGLRTGVALKRNQHLDDNFERVFLTGEDIDRKTEEIKMNTLQPEPRAAQQEPAQKASEKRMPVRRTLAQRLAAKQLVSPRAPSVTLV